MATWLFDLVLAALVVTIVVTIVRAMRLTRATIARAGRDVPLSQRGVAGDLARRIRERRVPCERCGRENTFALLGTGTRWKCDTCHHEFEGPAHIPTGDEARLATRAGWCRQGSDWRSPRRRCPGRWPRAHRWQTIAGR